MTLITNGSAPSPVGNIQDNRYKPESPPTGEIEGSRFKESLNKAIAEETRVSENNENNPQKEVRAEVPEQAGDSAVKLAAGKKRLLTESKKISRITAGKPDGKKEITEGSEADLVSIISGDLKKTKSPKISSEISLVKRSLKKDFSRKNGVSGIMEAARNKGKKINEDGLIQPLEISDEKQIPETRASEEASRERSGNEEAVVIPFPGNGESEIVIGSQLTKSPETAKSGQMKVQSGSSRKVKEEQTLSVIDTRSSKTENTKADFVSKTASISENVDQASKESNQIVLGEQNADRLVSEDSKSFESRFTENKEVLLSRELKESGNDQIVKKASFILKDNNQGEIKLILKPESLGRVKIHLNMNENNLVGKIIVENNRVGQIFENNLNDLSKSFEEAGVSSSSIEVSVGDGNKQNADQNQSFQNDQPFFSDRLKTMDESVPLMGRSGSENNHQLVNLVV